MSSRADARRAGQKPHCDAMPQDAARQALEVESAGVTCYCHARYAGDELA